MTFASVAASGHSHTAQLDLKGRWTFWFLIRHSRGAVQSSNYENAIQIIDSFSTAEGFWSIWGHLKRPSELPVNADYQVFRDGVRPVWEDKANAHGGKWVVRLRKGIASRLWEHLLLAMLAGMFDDCGICGAVISVRYAEDIISIWNKTADDEVEKARLRDVVKQVLCLPPHANLEYKAHDAAMKDSGNFRNAEKPRQ